MIRSILFKIFFYLGIVIICIVFLPSLLLNQKVVLFGGKLMGYWSKICLGVFLSTEIIVKGKENIPKNEKFFIACSHQSAFETFFLQTIFEAPIFILKKQLLKIPIFGWYLKKIGSISIDRNKISKENLDFSENIKKAVKLSNRPLIIFPQASRMSSSDRSPFKKGVARIYNDLNIKCQPVAINSGKVWPKAGNLISNQKIIISILKSIEPRENEQVFLTNLQNIIYQELDNLN